MVSKLQSLVSFWHTLGLPAVQAELDDVATQITARQDESEVSRKALIELMRDFKREHAEETRAAVAPLVKSFQNEVDDLSKRARAAEKAFFEAYKRLADMPDPVPVLEQALESQKSLTKLQDFEIEVSQLRQTIVDYNREIQDLKGKERRMHELQAKVDAYDKNIDETLNERIKDVTEQMLDEYNEKLAAMEEARQEDRRRAEETEAKLRAAQKQLKDTQAELFETLNGKEETRIARSELNELVLEDLESSNQRAAAAEKEVEMLRERLETLKEEASKVKVEETKDEVTAAGPNLAMELSVKEREVQHLLADLQKLKLEKQQEKEEADAEISTLSLAKDDAEEKVKNMEEKLQLQSDYESIKKDLDIMRSLEFPQENTEDKRPLEVMILERSKALQSENTTLRVEKDRLYEELSVCKRELSEVRADNEKRQILIAELEEHVERLQDLSNRGEAEGRSSADILVDALDADDFQSSSSPTTTQSDEASSSSKALLPIVQAQRERFRRRNEELEETQQSLLSQIGLLQTEVSDLRSDNVKLYEKIRFLQSFGGGGVGANKVSSVSIPVETRYQSQYEQKMDPFASFSQQERQRRYGQLSVFEKIILSFVQFMMSNKLVRLLTLAYAVLLHVLVFLVLMRLAHSDAHKRDLASEWHDRYLKHMEDAHGDAGVPGHGGGA